jgi:hypothetical protein
MSLERTLAKRWSKVVENVLHETDLELPRCTASSQPPRKMRPGSTPVASPFS